MRKGERESLAKYRVNDTFQTQGGDITIGNDVWIGMDSIVLYGVTTENVSVIATGSVVTQSIPEHVLVGGVPTRTIRQL